MSCQILNAHRKYPNPWGGILSQLKYFEKREKKKLFTRDFDKFVYYNQSLTTPIAKEEEEE